MRPARISTRRFLGRRVESDDVYARLSAQSQAALRQFSIERLLGYGLGYGDVTELRAAVIDGADWKRAAERLAETALAQAPDGMSPAGVPSRIAYFRRASGLLRMSLMMMLTDTDERRAIFVRAAMLYEAAAVLSADRESVVIETETGLLAGWLHPAAKGAVGSAIVIGGVEGWAMDFSSLGEALAARGVDALMLDGPGQGESRFQHGHYLTKRWRSAYGGAIDYLYQRSPRNRIAFIGNSIGGSFAMAMAAADPRIRACCNNGGVIKPSLLRAKPTVFQKMTAACGTDDEAKAAAIWETVTPVTPGHGMDYPLLIVQGGGDPLVTTPAAEELLDLAPTTDKQMVVFSDGDHCLYNHRDDRDILIADWTRSQLTR